MTRLIALAVLAGAFALTGCATPLHDAASRNDVDKIQKLIAAGAPVDAYNESLDQWTPLDYAAMAGNNEAVKALLAAGASPTHRSSGGTARQIALDHNHPDTAALIDDFTRRARGEVPAPPSEPEPAARPAPAPEAPAQKPWWQQ